MTKEKLLVSDDNSRAKGEIDTLESNIPRLQQLLKIFESLDIGELDEKTALSLLKDKGATAEEMFLNVIAADCMATGNRNKNFINQQIQAQEPTVNNFRNEIKNLLEGIGYFDFSDYSYKIGKGYFISESQKEIIIERNKKYLTDPQEIALYNEFKKAFESLQNLHLKLNQYRGHDISYSLYQYFESEDRWGAKSLYFDKNKVLEIFRKKIVI